MEAALTGAFSLTGDQPIVEEIFSAERLEQLAAALAAEHEISRKPQRGQRLLSRFEENGRLLRAAYKTLSDAPQAISPAAEWLVDNFHVIEEPTGCVTDRSPIDAQLKEDPGSGCKREASSRFPVQENFHCLPVCDQFDTMTVRIGDGGKSREHETGSCRVDSS